MAICCATFEFLPSLLVPLLFEELLVFLDLLSFFILFVETLATSLVFETALSIIFGLYGDLPLTELFFAEETMLLASRTGS